jgi:hypothetical protein
MFFLLAELASTDEAYETVAFNLGEMAISRLIAVAYEVSSNRAGSTASGLRFGRRGFVFASDGTLITGTSKDEPVVVFDLDP